MTSYMQVRKHPPTVLERYFLCIKCICNRFCRWAARYDDTNIPSTFCWVGLCTAKFCREMKQTWVGWNLILKKHHNISYRFYFYQTQGLFEYFCIYGIVLPDFVSNISVMIRYIYTYIQFVQRQCSSMAHGNEVRYTDWIRTWIMNIDFRIDNIYIYIYIYIYSIRTQGSSWQKEYDQVLNWEYRNILCQK